VSLLAACATGACLLWSYRISRNAADQVLDLRRCLLVYERGRFSLVGSKDNRTPSWVFQYGDIHLFDVIVRVQVSISGNVMNVYPRELEEPPRQGKP